MKITIDNNKKLSKEWINIAKSAVGIMIKHDDPKGISNVGDKRVVCERRDGGIYLEFHKSVSFAYKVIAKGTATVEAGA